MIPVAQHHVERKGLSGTQLLREFSPEFVGHGYQVFDTGATGGEDYSGFLPQVIRMVASGVGADLTRAAVVFVIPTDYPFGARVIEDVNATAGPSSPVFRTGYKTGGALGALVEIATAKASATHSLEDVVLHDVPSTLQSVRAQAGLPVQDLAAMFGIKRRQFYNLMSGEDTPDPARVRRISRVTEVIDMLSGRLTANSRSVRAALLARLDGDSIFDAAVSGDEDRILAAASRARDAIEHGIPRNRLAPSQRATRAEAEAVREFLRATRDDSGSSSES